MLARVGEFLSGHTGSTDSERKLADEFVAVRQELLAIGDTYRSERLGVSAVTKHRAVLRREITSGWLAHVVRTARRAVVEDPEFPVRYRLPKLRDANAAFESAARQILAQARQDLAVLEKYGLLPGTLETLAGKLDEWDRLSQRGTASRLGHVGARRRRADILRDAMRLVAQLDSVMQLRFADQPDILHAWKSASNIVLPGPTPAAETPPAPAATEDQPAA